MIGSCAQSVWGGRLLVYTDSELVALDSSTGKQAWLVRCLQVGDVTESPREGEEAPRAIGPMVFPAATLDGQVLLPTQAGCVALQGTDGTDMPELKGLQSISKDVRSDPVVGVVASDDIVVICTATWSTVFTSTGNVVQELTSGGTPILGEGSLFTIQRVSSTADFTLKRWVPTK